MGKEKYEIKRRTMKDNCDPFLSQIYRDRAAVKILTSSEMAKDVIRSKEYVPEPCS